VRILPQLFHMAIQIFPRLDRCEKEGHFPPRLSLVENRHITPFDVSGVHLGERRKDDHHCSGKHRGFNEFHGLLLSNVPH
jgi:hypothetical protein